LRFAGQAPRRCVPVSSNVRPHSQQSRHAPTMSKHYAATHRASERSRIEIHAPGETAPPSAFGARTPAAAQVVFASMKNTTPASQRELEVRNTVLSLSAAARAGRAVGFSAAHRANRAASAVRLGLTVGPNPSLNRTRNGMSPGPRSTEVIVALRGPVTTPLRAG
jgi:hypothetical protein